MSQIRVAILGGGVGAITAAYYLTEPALNGRYQVTIHQQGFRLGGKCATGRGECDRIEEHGLHMLMGYYERTFTMLRPVFSTHGMQLTVTITRSKPSTKRSSRSTS